MRKQSIDTRLVQGDFFNSQLHEWLEKNLWHQSPSKQGTPWPLLFATTCTVLWHTRNLFVFEAQDFNHQEVLNKCLWLANDHHLAQQSFSFVKKNISEFVVKQVRWNPPPTDWLKLNSDGLVFKHEASCGSIIRYHNGNFILGFSAKLGTCSVTHAEIVGYAIWFAFGC